ncbi:hypothetical protein KSP40_PGU018027 [Platanthera guangdongensis]|uniref:Uncharacterized protein n=1 Tax=Platanthera guangdongensis TaxID=2320717 RepID=A0ABR2MXB4_9ASPA
MAIVKTLVSLLRNFNSRSSLRFHSSAHSSLSSPPLSLPSPAFFVPPIPLFLPRLASPRSRLFFPISGWNPFSGPLFLLRPAWKLSPSATPLYLRGRGSVFPVGFGGSSAGVIRDGGEWKIRVEAGRDSFNETFFNLPNSISISRMVSGPVIGW